MFASSDNKKELFYKEYIRRENDILRAPYNPELEFYSVIKSGNVKKTAKLCSQPLLKKEGLGTLSDSPLQNIKYHFVITAALIARYCIEGGMNVSTAYNLSDFYIQKADYLKTVKEVSDLHPVMCMDYAKRMQTLRKQKVCSLPIARCIDYIYDHLHTKITLESLSGLVNLSPTYLSRLFKKETGISVSHYIQLKKIQTAENMLVYSDYSAVQIAGILAYPTQSYFTELFKKETGMTPVQYRNTHLRSTELARK